MFKKTVFGVVKDYYKELKKNQAEAIPFCELPDIIIDKVAIWDTYKTDYTTFNICGHDIYVYDDELAKVIKQLSDRYRENVLMYYFLDMSDTDGLKKKNKGRKIKKKWGKKITISKSCIRPLYDEYGNVYIAVDMELKGRIREAIMKMILNLT